MKSLNSRDNVAYRGWHAGSFIYPRFMQDTERGEINLELTARSKYSLSE